MKLRGRNFYVLRIRNGETTILNVTLLFATNCFLTYTLVFEDKILPDSSITLTQSDNSHNNGGDLLTDNPKNNPQKTSELTNINIFVAILASLFICLVNIYYKERYNR